MLPPLLLQNRFLVLDIESTGISSKTDQIIQLAFGQIDYGKPKLRGYYVLLPQVAIKPGATMKHGIREVDLQWAPNFSDVAPEFKELMGTRTLLGYNARTFDARMLRRQFDEAHIHDLPDQLPTLDILYWARKLVPGVPHTLSDMVRHFGLQPFAAHDAWADCKATWKVAAALALTFPTFGNMRLEDALAAQEPKNKKAA